MAKINILGTGMVGRTIARKMHQLGYDVYVGTRDVSATLSKLSEKSQAALFEDGTATLASYDQLPADADIFINATNGAGSLAALQAVGSDKLMGKTVIDIANPLDFSNGMPPSLFVCNTDSLAETLQRAFPDTHIVKSLNTMNCELMMNPSLVPGHHAVFVCGNDAAAKSAVTALLKQIGWADNTIYDLGDISAARGTEMMLPVWLRLWQSLGTASFNFGIIN